MCRPKPNLNPHVRGKWRGTLPKGYPLWDLSRTPYSAIDLPYIYNKYSNNPKAVAQRDSLPPPLPMEPYLGECLLTRLPMEILLQITEYLVPTDVSFHVFPSTRDRHGGTKSTFVHKFAAQSPYTEDRVEYAKVSPGKRHLTALSQTCSILSEAYHITMYGKNHFIIELSSHDLYPHIEGERTPPVESWARIFRGRKKGLWPLTKQNIHYVRHLTILGCLHWEEKSAARAALREHLLLTIPLLKQAQRLKSLTIDLRGGGAGPWRTKAPGPPPPPSPNARLGWGIQGFNDIMLRLRETTTSGEYPSLNDFWVLFKDLRGIRDVLLSGHIAPELAEDLRAKMMREPVPLRSAKATRSLPDRGAKRKQAVESLGQIKSRRTA